MTFTIVLEAQDSKEIYNFAEAVHDSLVGNKDYIESNIILNFDNGKDPQEATMLVDLHVCEDPVTAVTLAVEAVKTFYNNTL